MLQPRTGPCWAPARDRFLYIRAFGPLYSSFFFSFRFLLYRLPIDRASPSLLSVPVPILPEPSQAYLLILFVCRYYPDTTCEIQVPTCLPLRYRYLPETPPLQILPEYLMPHTAGLEIFEVKLGSKFRIIHGF